jgi:transcriptional repressor NrdR
MSVIRGVSKLSGKYSDTDFVRASRPMSDELDAVIRYRREGINCTQRFTTYDHIEKLPIMIIKKDRYREVFSHRRNGSRIRKPFRKMDISLGVKDGPERDPQETGDKEFLSHNIGEGNC